MTRSIKNKKYLLFMMSFTVAFIGLITTSPAEANRDAPKSTLHGSDYFPLGVPEKAVSYELKGDKWHAQNTLTVQMPDLNNNRLYKFSIIGDGTFDQYKEVSWEKEAYVIDEPYGLRTVSSKSVIKDERQMVIDKINYTYNYETNKVTYERWFNNGDYKKKIYDIKGPISDEVTMVQFVRKYVEQSGEDEDGYFYLLTKMPSLYKVRITKLSEEILSINDKEINAVKLQLKADLGPLTEIMAALVAPTYLWYEAEHPYRWIQYEGMDSGRRSKHIKAVVHDG